MKKLLLTTALVGVAFTAAPAMAEVSLGLGGHFKGYMTYHDQDEVAGQDLNKVDILRDTEIHFTGETTLDNGLTVGFHAETKANGGETSDFEESYLYMAGNWGRVNFGAEDGASYLLQVAAPAADTNVDGIRQYINPMNIGGFGVALDYAADASGYADKITYITPVFSGFQAGVSYTPEVAEAEIGATGFDPVTGAPVLGVVGVGGGYAGAFGVRDNALAVFGEAYEGAVRYEGQFDAARVSLGGGYTHVEAEAAGLDDRKAWNVGANVGFGPFNVGAAYVTDNNATDSSDSDTFVVGVDYTTGPFVLGASYLNREDEDAGIGADDLETDRFSAGVTYTYGPGMSFRGSVHHVQADLGADDLDGTSVLLGTQVNF